MTENTVAESTTPTDAAPRRRTRSERPAWHLTAIGVVLVGAFLFPLYWMVSTSLKSPDQLFTRPPTWFPTELDFSNYARAVFENETMLRSLDYDMFVRLALRCRPRYVDAVIFDQRKHEGARGPAQALHAEFGLDRAEAAAFAAVP